MKEEKKIREVNLRSNMSVEKAVSRKLLYLNVLACLHLETVRIFLFLLYEQCPKTFNQYFRQHVLVNFIFFKYICYSSHSKYPLIRILRGPKKMSVLTGCLY